MPDIMFPEVARSLFSKGVFEFGEFRLKLHEKRPKDPPSPYKINLRKIPDGPLDDRDIYNLGSLVWLVTYCECDDPGFTSVVGVPRAGDPLASVIARILRVPQGRLVKEEHNGQRRIVGPQRDPVLAGSVLLVDDVVTEADSKIEAARAIRYAKGMAWHASVVVDREQGGKEALFREGLTLHSVWRAGELFAFLRDDERIEDKEYQRVARYTEWYKTHPAVIRPVVGPA